MSTTTTRAVPSREATSIAASCTPPAAGVYVFGDLCTGRIWGLFPNDGSSRTVAELGRSDTQITSFGEDESGELYVVGVG